MARVSALTGSGIDGLKELITQIVWQGEVGSGESALVTNVRHQVALERALAAVEGAVAAAGRGLTEEYLASDLREALDALGEIVGATGIEDIIDRIFESFCIGK